jgi:hypothetical protein
VYLFVKFCAFLYTVVFWLTPADFYNKFFFVKKRKLNFCDRHQNFPFVVKITMFSLCSKFTPRACQQQSMEQQIQHPANGKSFLLYFLFSNGLFWKFITVLNYKTICLTVFITDFLRTVNFIELNFSSKKKL